MPEAHDALMLGARVVNDTLRGVFFEPHVELKLLKASPSANAFQTVETITEYWFFEYSNFRQNFLLEIAMDAFELETQMAEATHVKVDDDIYTIRTADTTPPKGTDVTWKIFCDRFETRGRFGAIY